MLTFSKRSWLVSYCELKVTSSQMFISVPKELDHRKSQRGQMHRSVNCLSHLRCLGLPLGLEASVMTPNGVIVHFCLHLRCHALYKASPYCFKAAPQYGLLVTVGILHTICAQMHSVCMTNYLAAGRFARSGTTVHPNREHTGSDMMQLLRSADMMMRPLWCIAALWYQTQASPCLHTSTCGFSRRPDYTGVRLV